MSVPHTAARGRLGNLKQLSSLLGTLLGLPPHSRSKLSSPVKAVITVGLKILQDRPRLFSLALPLVCTPFFPRFQSQGLLVVYNIPPTLLLQGLCTACSHCLGCSIPRSPRGSLPYFMRLSAQMSPPQRSLPLPPDPEGRHVQLGRLFTTQSTRLYEGGWTPGHMLLSKL